MNIAIVYTHGLPARCVKKGRTIDDVMRIAIIIDAVVTNCQRVRLATEESGRSRAVHLVTIADRDYSYFFLHMRARAKKKSTQLYGGYGLISVAIISRVSLYYTMAVTSAHAVINYDGSRNHYRGVSCNSGVLSVYIRL